MKIRILLFLTFIVFINKSYSQVIYIGADAGINGCYLGGSKVKKFYSFLNQINHVYRPGFSFGFTSDFYPIKANIFLVSINIGYQQYAQAITWSGKPDSQYYLSYYAYHESKVNREIYYSLQAGFCLKNFVFKSGITCMQTIASSGVVTVNEGNNVVLNSGNVRWHSNIYKLHFDYEELLAVPLYFSYNINLTNKLCIAPALLFDIGCYGFNYVDFATYGNVWGRIVKGSIGVSFKYSVYKAKK